MNNSPKLLVFSGAGLSADSGISTFRDPDGVWQKYDVDEVCHISTWKKNYREVHDFYGDRRENLGLVTPNKMHHVLANLQQQYGSDVVELWTQNVDDLLEQAGAGEVKHIHGFLTEMICETCGHIWNVGYVNNVNHSCEVCYHNIIKPNVVFFGQLAPLYTPLIVAFRDAMQDHRNTILVIGTSGVVVPLKWIIGDRPNKNEAFKILCNKETIDVNLSIFDMCFIKPAAVASWDLSRALTDRLEGTLEKLI